MRCLSTVTRYSWWYNWKVTANHDLPPDQYCTCSGDCGDQPTDKSFIPMVWNIDLMLHDPVEDKYPIVLGFNEPNHADQSNIEPEVAAAAWIELQNMYPDKVISSHLILSLDVVNILRSSSVPPLLEEMLTGLILSSR